MSEDNSLVQRIFSAFSSSILSLAIGVLFTPALVRLLSKSEYGQYAFILSLFGVITSIVDGGFFDGARKFVAEDRADSNWKSIVFGFYLRAGLLTAGLASAIIIVLNTFGIISTLFGNSVASLIWLLIGMIFARQLFLIIRGGLIANSLERISEPLRTTRKGIMAVTAISLVVVGLDVEGALVGHLFSEWIAVLVGIVFISKKIDLSYTFKLTPISIPRRELILFSMKSTVLSVLLAALFNTDIILIQYFYTDSTTGVYNSAVVIMNFLNVLPLAVSTVFVAESSSLWENENPSTIERNLAPIVKYTLLISILFGVGMFTLADPFVRIYLGTDYSFSSSILKVLIPAGVMMSVIHPVIAANQGINRLRPLIIATLLAAILNVLLTSILLIEVGVIGAGIATTLCYAVLMSLLIISSKQGNVNPLTEFETGRSLIVGAVVLTILKILESSLIWWQSLLLIPPIGAGIYVGLLVKIDVIDITDVLSHVKKLKR